MQRIIDARANRVAVYDNGPSVRETSNDRWDLGLWAANTPELRYQARPRPVRQDLRTRQASPYDETS
jgi:hypothetical protein